MSFKVITIVIIIIIIIWEQSSYLRWKGTNICPQIMHDIEDYLSEMCHDRTEPTEEECDEAADTDLLPAYIPENGQGARLTMSSSVPLLSR